MKLEECIQTTLTLFPGSWELSTEQQEEFDMGLADRLKEAGFKPTANTDGEFQPYNGTYAVTWKTLRPEVDKKNADAKYVQAEWDIDETLAGDPKRDSKYPAFARRYYFDLASDDERQQANLERLMKDIFTATSIDLAIDSEMDMMADFEKIVNQKAYIKAWAWTPDEKQDGTVIPETDRKPRQQFVVQKASVAEKKRTTASLPF